VTDAWRQFREQFLRGGGVHNVAVTNSSQINSQLAAKSTENKNSTEL